MGVTAGGMRDETEPRSEGAAGQGEEGMTREWFVGGSRRGR
jgi:hypothetical protein